MSVESLLLEKDISKTSFSFLIASESWQTEIAKEVIKEYRSRFSNSKFFKTTRLTFLIKGSIESSLFEKGYSVESQSIPFLSPEAW